jgi:hypothetical protein
MLVDLVNVVVWADCAAVCIAVYGRKEERTLSLPVIGREETRSKRRSVARSSVLPVVKWLIAKHPVPLPVGAVADSSVGKVQVRCIIRIKAF